MGKVRIKGMVMINIVLILVGFADIIFDFKSGFIIVPICAAMISYLIRIRNN